MPHTTVLTARNFLKVLQSNTFKKFLGLGLSVKRYNLRSSARIKHNVAVSTKVTLAQY